SAQAQIESMRRQLRAATEDVTPTNVDERVRAVVQAASVDATRIRDAAEAAGELERNGAADAAARVRAAGQAQGERLVGPGDAQAAPHNPVSHATKEALRLPTEPYVAHAALTDLHSNLGHVLAASLAAIPEAPADDAQ